MASQLCAGAETAVPDSATPCADPVNPDTAFLLAWANLLGQQYASQFAVPCLPVNIPALVDLLGRGVSPAKVPEECSGDRTDPVSPTRKRPRVGEVDSPSVVCPSSANELSLEEGSSEAVSAVPSASATCGAPSVDLTIKQDRPISYVTLNATGTHWLISTPVNGGLLRHFLPPAQNRLDDLLSFQAPADLQRRQIPPSTSDLVSTSSVFDNTEAGQRLRNSIDQHSELFSSEQTFTSDLSPTQNGHADTVAVQSQPGHPVSPNQNGSPECGLPRFLAFPETDILSGNSCVERMDVSREGNTPNSVVPTHLPHLDICWGATANVSGWPAADVLPDPAQLPIFCRNVDAESTDVDNSSTSGKGCTTRTCCTEDEFPLEGEKQEATEAYSEMAKKLPKLAGVIFDRVHARWVSTYHDKETRKVMRKYFGVRKHGFEQAYKMAVQHRKLKIMSKHSENDPETRLHDGLRQNSGDMSFRDASGSVEEETDGMNKNVCYETLFKTLPRVTGVSYDSYAMKFRAGFMSNGKWNVKDFPIRKYGTFAEAYRRAVSCRQGNSRADFSRKCDGSTKTAAVAEVSAAHA
uniref:Malaria antigen, putative n=1 Tax=Toxoplasma gondii (strain ATCC 50861 / VEG) TaxID=432359 RepID=A0A0F7UZP9_TOXGV|nr:TPA: malaria antigen, putative [Toxoplasma gondii VEG]